MLDFRLLTFLTLCNTGSYTRAAEELHITQPAVTQHIKYLEKQYGVALFNRSEKRLTTTDAGNLLYRVATTMYADAQRTLEQMQTHTGHLYHLRFAATPTVGEFVLPPMLNRYLSNHADVKLSMYIDDTENILHRLEAGEIDFAIVEGYFSRAKFDFRAFGRDRFIPVCGPEYSLPDILSSLYALLNEPLLLQHRGADAREVLARVLQEKNLSLSDFTNISEYSSINIIKHLVLCRKGVTFLYESAVRQELEEGNLRELRIPDFYVCREYYFIVLKGSVFKKEYESLVFHELLSSER